MSLSPRTMKMTTLSSRSFVSSPLDTGHASLALVDAYASINFVGVILLLSLLITIGLSYTRKKKRETGSTIKRDPCLINAFVIVILVNILNTLFYIQNRHQLDENDPSDQTSIISSSSSSSSSSKRDDSYTFGNGTGIDYPLTGINGDGYTVVYTGVCRFQAILQPGSQAAQAAAVLAVVIRLWLKTIRLTIPWFNKFRRWPTLTLLLALPYLCFLAFIPPVAVLTQSWRKPHILPIPFYCAFVDQRMQASRILSLFLSAIALGLETHTMILVYRHFRQTHDASLRAGEAMTTSFGVDMTFVKPHRSMSNIFFIRVILFVGWTAVTLATTLFQAFDSYLSDPSSDLAFACIAPVAFFCFASQPDILRAWHIPATESEWRILLRLDSSPPMSQRYLRSKNKSNSNYARRQQESDDNTLGLHEFLGSYTDSEMAEIEVEIEDETDQLNIVEIGAGAGAGGMESKFDLPQFLSLDISATKPAYEYLEHEKEKENEKI